MHVFQLTRSEFFHYHQKQLKETKSKKDKRYYDENLFNRKNKNLIPKMLLELSFP